MLITCFNNSPGSMRDVAGLGSMRDVAGLALLCCVWDAEPPLLFPFFSLSLLKPFPSPNPPSFFCPLFLPITPQHHGIAEFSAEATRLGPPWD